ncbi:MAG: cytochrome P450 [Pseudomonadota bacterium]
MNHPIPLRDDKADIWSVPLSQIDVANGDLFAAEQHWEVFRRLREEAPVHYCAESQFGPYWSISRFDDIKFVDRNHELFSSEGGIVIDEGDDEFPLPMFIAMDPPKHDQQRAVVSPTVAPQNLANLETTIRTRVIAILDSLPIDEPFDWVDRVSIELTTQMLATLFDFPWEERRKLTWWSDVVTGGEAAGLVDSEEEWRAEMMQCLAFFTGLWEERLQQPPSNDFISMLVHGTATKDMPPEEYLGNLLLLIVGGNDTTRNSITGGVYALNQFPGEYDKLRANPKLIPNMVSEIIRWQTPLAHMRRTATTDVELRGQKIAKGDKVIMWYVSGNRDPDAFEDPDRFLIDRKNARQHVSFGFGIHRCMGNRLAEMQLRILWEELIERFHKVEVVTEPERTKSSFVKGYQNMLVRLVPHGG